MGLSELFNRIGIKGPHSESFAFSPFKEGLQVLVVVPGRLKSYNNGHAFSQKMREGKGILSKEPESFRKIGVVVRRSQSFLILIHKENIQALFCHIYSYEKCFSTHRFFSFENFGYLTPCFPDGYYPPGLRALGTLYNQISPSGTGEPFSLSCSWHTNHEGFARYLDNFKYSIFGNTGKTRINMN